MENKVRIRLKVDFNVDFNLTEAEANALDALAGYGTKEFLKVFYEKMGRAYLEPHEKGLISLFEKARSLRPYCRRANEMRKLAQESIKNTKPI